MKLHATKLVRTASLVCLAGLASACSGSNGNEAVLVEASASAVVYGAPSTEEEDYVVDLYVGNVGVCTGTLIAPNVVVTALHCVSKFNRNLPFTCNAQGELKPQAAGAGEFGELVAPERLEVRVGPAPASNEPDARALRIFGTGSLYICQNDLAVAVLDTSLSPPPRQVRLGTPTPKGERASVVGYGQDELGTIRIRNRRGGLRVVGVGEFEPYEADGLAAPRTLMVGEGPCFGDSGGPLFSEETGALIGVFSLGASSGCEGAAVRNTFTQVAAFGNLLREAAEFAGAELSPEPARLEPSGGAGGDTGSGGALETGGSASGGGAATAGNVGTGGSGLEGSGGTSSGGSGNEGNTPSGGTRSGEGSGSREDPSCTCRFETLGSSNGASAWVGFLAVVAGALLRRRRS